MTETMDVQLDETASMAEADRILSEAGWSPVRVVVSSGGEVTPNTRGAFAFKNLVCGHPPEGSRMTYAGKELTKIPQAKAAVLGLDPADYPDTHHEAAAWLVEHAKPKNALSTAATLEPIAVEAAPETEETPGDEAHGETGSDTDASEGGLRDAESASSSDASSISAEPVAEDDAPIDADFAEPEVPAALEGDDLAEPLALEFGAEMAEHEEATQAQSQASGQNTFIGLDDLDRARAKRIEAVNAYAAILIAAIAADAAERPDEFSEVNSYVVTRLDKHTGAFVAKDATEQAVFDRFMTLSNARVRTAQVDAMRKDKIIYLTSASRAEVEQFDPEGGW